MKKALFSKVAGSLLLSAGLLASGVAAADETVTFQPGGVATFGITHNGAGSFSDTFLFSVDTASWLSGSAIVGYTAPGGQLKPNFDITGVTFFSEVNGVRTDLAANVVGDDSLMFGVPTLLQAGTYGFTVTGSLANGLAAGSYAGNLAVAPVPEPSTYAMLGLGLGLLAFTARRKSGAKLG
ncbi:FxDxF family PEP-CTERM protein [Pseudoduganella plicata]|uniref:Ice-binding protein C-terminal domain-containing protein n=2 Tax=Pseudoduganella plicata TaxID=321984 RepID=A0AA87YCC8_9BURK|nr:FxDxF family PEP-CTERM protein [Pseudoduganella plicata]GGY87880.1 hypothetical protein GCM10007388_21590 [Pseudoduganella plicata]